MNPTHDVITPPGQYTGDIRRELDIKNAIDALNILLRIEEFAEWDFEFDISGLKRKLLSYE
jgi:hypothetical protein